MDTIVLTTRTTWDEPPRIRHQIAWQLAKNYRVIFVETPAVWRKRYGTSSNKIKENIHRVQLSNKYCCPGRIDLLSSTIHNFTERYLLDELLYELNKLRTGKLILFNFNYDFLNLMHLSDFTLKIYFCNDDFPAMALNKQYARITLYREQQVAQSADLCLAVSYPLEKKLKRLNKNTHLFLPGHSFSIGEHMSMPINNSLPIKVGFMGYIDYRLHYEWLHYAGEQNDLEMHLIGPVEAGCLEGPWCLYGSKSGSELQTILENMDILIMPYRTSLKFINAVTAPNKLFSYLAVGKPVVISDMPNFLDLGPGVIYRAKTKEDFVKKIRVAYNENNTSFVLKRLDIARQNTWDIRGEELKRIIVDNLAKFVG